MDCLETMRRIVCLSTVCLLMLAVQTLAWAQFKEDTGKGWRLGEPVVHRWQAGIVVKAVAGACKNMVGTAPLPRDWPEQQVEIVEEDFSPGVSVQYRTVNNLVEQMVVKIPNLPNGQEAKAIVTVEIRRFVQLPPENTSIFKIPTTMPAQVRMFLTPSPKIESHDPKIKEQAKQLITAGDHDWEKVRAIYTFVREHVQYKSGAPLRGAIVALKEGIGDCEDMTSLFVALCRAAGIPARTVWVPGHCYGEFYLVDDEGNGYWFPCQLAGTEAFGEMPDPRPILQKGDNFVSPVNPRERVRYLAETLTGGGVGGHPQVQFIRKQVAN
ncbi:MAG: transglutaminase domain-containing protein [Thermogutta sp.]